jgi:hypothetical protein
VKGKSEPTEGENSIRSSEGRFNKNGVKVTKPVSHKKGYVCRCRILYQGSVIETGLSSFVYEFLASIRVSITLNSGN